MKSNFYFNWPLLVAVFLLGHVSASRSNEKFIKNVNCIATSGNQNYCNVFLQDCTNELPDKYSEAYKECLKERFPNGISKCTTSQELFESAKKRRQLNDCIDDKVGNYQLNRIDELRFSFFHKCTSQLAKLLGCQAPK
ncbi:unnamed protein product [Larinioides sclopetarius]|uniref:Uncharacterized protein n=1 Tax=Larinioides sclopetarius TaxID=280406 RepID=A0AAV1ZVV6_9ARAC